MPARYELSKTSDGQFHFNLKAANNETILTSERYVAKAGARNGIASVRSHSTDDAAYVRKQASDGQFYFVLRAANNKVLGRSERYTTEAARENGIASVKTNGPTAEEKDLT